MSIIYPRIGLPAMRNFTGLPVHNVGDSAGKPGDSVC